MVNPRFAPCPSCGNPRTAGDSFCPFCGSNEAPDVPQSNHIHTINLKENLPTVELAMEKFDERIDQLAHQHARLVKVIHGYGSSGKGGLIKQALRQMLDHRRHMHLIDSFIGGEDLDPGKDAPSDFFKRYPQLKSTLTRDMFGNPGITLILLKKL